MQTRKDGIKEPLRRKKSDPLVANNIETVDYKDINVLRKFLSETGKILPARITISMPPLGCLYDMPCKLPAGYPRI